MSGMMEQVWSVFGGLDILVNKVLATFHDTTITGLQAATGPNLGRMPEGSVLCTKHAIPLMQFHHGGSIVTISSVNALRGVSEAA